MDPLMLHSRFRSVLCAAAFAVATWSAGPFDGYQTADLYYNPNPTIYGEDIGGPQNLGEEYRWNVPVIYYGFDYTFLDYFGQRGVEEVEKAIAVFAALPAFSTMSADLREYPTSAYRINHRASALGLMDLKSAVMSMILEELGLTMAERYVWTLRFRQLLPGAQCPVYEHRVIKRNFDPETWLPTSYVNDVLYTYLIVVSCPPAQDFSHALEYPVDPTAITHTSISSRMFNYQLGGFYTGLTRDDVGGLRYIYRASNYNVEDLPPGAQVTTGGVIPGGGIGNVGGGGGGGDGSWTPLPGPSTNQVTDPTAPADPGTGTPTIALRPGIDRLRFQRVDYDSVLGSTFPDFTNIYSATIITNGRAVSQRVIRPVTQPDIVFSAADMLDGLASRDQPAYVQAPAPDGGQDINGPGTIPPGLNLTVSKIGPAFESTYPLLGEDSAIALPVWGSFDGTTNAPVVYPSQVSILELERRVLGR
jgi:hypothetical protein